MNNRTQILILHTLKVANYKYQTSQYRYSTELMEHTLLLNLLKLKQHVYEKRFLVLHPVLKHEHAYLHLTTYHKPSIQPSPNQKPYYLPFFVYLQKDVQFFEKISCLWEAL